MDIDDPDVQAEERAWVKCTERGAAQANSGQLAAAEENWQRAGRIAECFDEGDPRHAASLNNLAVVARLSDRLEDADRLYQRALHVWEQARGWVERMQPASRARSSLFHMRLELRHREHFARLALDEYHRQLPRGAAVTLNNRAEWNQHTDNRVQARSLYRTALERYAATLEAPAHGVEAIRRNSSVLADAQRGKEVVVAQHAVWAPALEHSFRAVAEREGWIVDRPPEFTDEGRFMAGLMWVCLIEHTRAVEPR